MKIMQKIILSLTFLLFLSQVAKAQSQKEKLSFEFGYGVNSYQMNDLNKFYIDGWAETTRDNNWFFDHINFGNNFSLGLNYQAFKSFDFGVYGSYQYGKSDIVQGLSEQGNWRNYHLGNAQLRTEAIGVGISSTYFFSETLGFQEKESTLNRLHLGLEFNGGIGFSRAVISSTFETYPEANLYGFFNSQDFQGQLGLKVIYDFVKSPLITSLGLRIGYQYFKTNNLANLNGNQMFGINVQENGASQPVELDFSGIYVGTFLIIGK